jgi:hypothetical protein
MDQILIAALSALGLFAGMIILLEVGRRIGIRHMAKDPDGARAGIGVVEGAIFGLMGLLIAFTFSGAAFRFDTRRQLIIDETNAIGTAYLRLDLLPPDAQSSLKESFRKYVDSRLDVYKSLPDIEAAKKEYARSVKLQGEIWTQAVAACQAGNNPPAAILLLPALNQMIDITTTRTMATKIHPPQVIFVLLAALTLASALLAGYSMAGGKTRSLIHMFCFAAIMAITMYVILDIEFPRLGFIRVDTFDQALVDLRQSMK